MSQYVNEGLKGAIVTLLKSNVQVNMDCDLACYPAGDGYFHVDYLYSKETINLLDLTDEERAIIMEEEELMEIFDTAEEAAEFYLRLCKNDTTLNGPIQQSKPKRNLRQKVGCYNRDKYF